MGSAFSVPEYSQILFMTKKKAPRGRGFVSMHRNSGHCSRIQRAVRPSSIRLIDGRLVRDVNCKIFIQSRTAIKLMGDGVRYDLDLREISFRSLGQKYHGTSSVIVR